MGEMFSAAVHCVTLRAGKTDENAHSISSAARKAKDFGSRYAVQVGDDEKGQMDRWEPSRRLTPILH